MPLFLVQEELVLELLLVLLNKDSKLLVFLNFSPLDPILLLLKVVSMQHWEISLKMIGDGTLMTPLKVLIGLVIKTLFIICVEKLPKLFLNLNHMVCLFQELLKVYNYK